MNNKKFKRWLKRYDYFYKKELRDYWAKNGMNVLKPENFDKEFLYQFIAYRNEIQTKRLVIATWILAGASIILSIISLFV